MLRALLVSALLLSLVNPSAFGQSIYESIDSGRVAVVGEILNEHPEILNSRNDNGMTPLSQAAYRGQIEIMRLLLAAGADITIGDNENSGPLHNAAVGGSVEAVALLIASGADVNTRDDNGMVPLLYALNYSHPDVARLLIERGADPAASSPRGTTAVHYAVIRGLEGMIAGLADAGADIDAQNGEGSTPLITAVEWGNLDGVRKLLELGANTELANEYGRTPLLIVARESGDVDMAGLLIEHGADVNALDKFGDSPLTLAAWRGYEAVVNLLLDHGADVATDGRQGAQLIQYAPEKALERLMEKLIEKNADLSTGTDRGGNLLHAAAEGGSPDIVRTLLEQGLTAEQVDPYGWTPLHYAAAKGRTAVVEILLDHGVDLDTRTLSGLTPYNLADRHDRTEVASVLAARGADRSPRQFPLLTGPYLGMKPPGDEPAPVAPDIISDNWGNHSSVTFSPDGAEAFWSAYIIPSDSGYGRGRLLTSKLVDGHWTEPSLPSFAILEAHDDVPFFSPDGSRLYFISRRPLEPGGASSGENVWIVERAGTGWGEPYPAPGELNSAPKHWQFSVASSGTIYFAGSGDGELGRGDIYKSVLVNGVYARPTHLGSVINTDQTETSPCIAPDESFLLFASMGHHVDGDGPMEIFISWPNLDGSWTEPVAIGIEGLCPIISPDGKYLFFNGAAGGINGMGIVWVKADFLERLRPAEI